jgi:chromosome partitioning protein
MAKILTLTNQKGGVGKSTSVIHLGVALAELGQQVLLVDLDPQGHLAEGFGVIADNLANEMSDVIEGTKQLSDIIIKKIRPNLDLAPSNIRLSDMELTLVNMPSREYKLRQALEPVKNAYDYVLIDCPPNLGLLTINALMASNHVLIPMAAEFYAMLGVSLLINTVNSIRDAANPGLSVLGIIHTRYKHTVHAREVVERTKAELGNSIHVFEATINESTRFPEASGQGTTVFEIAPDIPGAVAYRQIAKEIINRG